MSRTSYGSIYNSIYINHTEKTVRKVCHSEDGQLKIQSEIIWFKFFIQNSIDFPIPKIITFGTNEYTMEYLSDYQPLYLVYPKLDFISQDQVLEKVLHSIQFLHQQFIKKISYQEYRYHLKIETECKLKERYKLICNVLDKYSYIKKVNGVQINMNFDEIVAKLNQEIDSVLEKKDDFRFTLIHGDCQFNNILIDKQLNIKFIDPRGYFGKNKILGAPEYDYAKILFALSGYDEFDNRTIDHLDIDNDNINVVILHLRYNNHIDTTNKLYHLILLSIWLGNPQAFINYPYKLITSYFIGVYLCLNYLDLK